MARNGRELKHRRPVSEERIVFGRVIAERAYRLGRRRLRLQVGTPHEASWGGDFYCPFRIVEDRDTLLAQHAFGVDALQALQLAFTAMKLALEGISPRIRWLPGMEPGEVGIGLTTLTGFGVKGTQRLERLVQRETTAMLKAFERTAMRRTRKSQPRSAR